MSRDYAADFLPNDQRNWITLLAAAVLYMAPDGPGRPARPAHAVAALRAAIMEIEAPGSFFGGDSKSNATTTREAIGQ